MKIIQLKPCMHIKTDKMEITAVADTSMGVHMAFRELLQLYYKEKEKENATKKNKV